MATSIRRDLTPNNDGDDDDADNDRRTELARASKTKTVAAVWGPIRQTFFTIVIRHAGRCLQNGKLFLFGKA
jgi:hypothetical protein